MIVSKRASDDKFNGNFSELGYKIVEWIDCVHVEWNLEPWSVERLFSTLRPASPSLLFSSFHQTSTWGSAERIPRQPSIDDTRVTREESNIECTVIYSDLHGSSEFVTLLQICFLEYSTAPNLTHINPHIMSLSSHSHLITNDVHFDPSSTVPSHRRGS